MTATTDDEALDAYSRVVTSVADRLLPSVASLRVMVPVPGGRRPQGSGSGVVVTPDGFQLDFEVVGTDPLSDLAVIRVPAAGWPRPPWATPTACGWASWWWPSGTPSASPGRSAPGW